MTPATDCVASISIRKIIMEGDAAPGTEPGVVFDSFFAHNINPSGEVAFRATLSKPNSSFDDTGFWVETDTGLNLIIREGVQAPGMDPGVTLVDIKNSNFNKFNEFTFVGNVSGPGINSINNSTVWSHTSGSLSLIVQENDPAPEYPSDHLISFSSVVGPFFNDNGHVAFTTSLRVPTPDPIQPIRGIWTDRTGSLALVAGSGLPAPSDGEDYIFTNVANHPQLNNNDQLAFQAGISGPGITPGVNGSGIWSERSGSLQQIVRRGDNPPGTELGTAYDSFFVPDQNDTGAIVYWASLTGPNVFSFNDVGIWVNDSDGTRLIAREGSPVPGLEGTAKFKDFKKYSIANDGRVLFSATATGAGYPDTFYTGMWLSDPHGNLKRVFMPGERVPGTSADVTYREPCCGTIFNDVGQVTTLVVLEGISINDANDRALISTDINGNKMLSLREGQFIDVNTEPGIEDLRIIASIGTGPSRLLENPAHASAFEIGHTVELLFTDGSNGIFVISMGIVGDFNNDGFIGIQDLNTVLLNWNQSGLPGYSLDGDANGDGFVGIDDLTTVLGNWNTGAPPETTAAIPEPGMLMLLTAGIGWQLCRPGKRLY